ncbi:MAG TPA: DsbA family protein [Kofleriaceae bacterium]|nr:DsbA family protein [Kofleriaceae bacterium]
MTLVSKLKGAAIDAFLGSDKLRHAAAELRRKATGKGRVVDFYFDLADPWSYLAAQVAQRLTVAYPIDLRFHFVSPPASDVDPAPDMRRKHALRDAIELAQFWDVDFPGKKEVDPGPLRRGGQILIKPRADQEQLAVALEVATTLWNRDEKKLTSLMGKHGTEASGSLPPYLASSYSELRKAGHYQGAMFGYGGDWYWGLDRLAYLEARLREDTGVEAPPVLSARPESDRAPEKLGGIASGRPVLEFWFSFRSPYAYLALGRTRELAQQFDLELNVRPIMPMVARGLAMPRDKRFYIVRDANREANRLGIPFGNISDPLGKGVENALAIAKLAIERGKGLDFLESAARGAWSEARDLADYVDLRDVVERVGLAWDDAKAALADDSWRVWAQDNAADLDGAGLWGVPSWRVGDYVTWGQDRLPMLADRLRRHFAAS